MESDPQLLVPIFPDSLLWNKFRKFINRSLKFKVIAKSLIFEVIMFLVVLFNASIIKDNLNFSYNNHSGYK
jgi:hypothetical protein